MLPQSSHFLKIIETQLKVTYATHIYYQNVYVSEIRNWYKKMWEVKK